MIKRPDRFGNAKLYRIAALKEEDSPKPIATTVFMFISDIQNKISLSFSDARFSFQHHIGEPECHFQFPRYKQISNEHFILSGALEEDGELFLVIARFNGQPPPFVVLVNDSLEYDNNYWDF